MIFMALMVSPARGTFHTQVKALHTTLSWRERDVLDEQTEADMNPAKPRRGGRGIVTLLTVLLTLSLLALSSFTFAQEETTETVVDIADLRSVTLLEPNNVAAWIDLGQAYFEAERPDDAKESFLKAIKLDYSSGDAHFGLGLSEYARGDFETALFEFGEVTRLYPERFDGHFNRAVTLVRLRRPEEAVEAFREALAQGEPEAGDDDLVSAYLGLAGQLKVLETYKEAAEAYQAALELSPDNAKLTYLRGDALYRAGTGLEALPQLTELANRTTEFPVSALMADIYAQAGQIDYALRALNQALSAAQENGDSGAQGRLLVKLGLLQRSLGRQSEAANSFRRAVQVAPDSWQALYNLGVTYLEGGQTQNAVKTLESALRYNTDSGDLRLALASAYDQAGRPQEALRQAEAALQRLDDPALITDATSIKGRSLYRLGDYRGALEALERVTAERPDSATAQLWAGLAHYQLGDYQNATQYYERAVQLEPNSTSARINLGAAYLASQRYVDAELVYELLVEQNPGDAESHYNLGWALFSQGSREDARQAWQTALELGYAAAGTPLNDYY